MNYPVDNTEVVGIGMEVVPNVPKYRVPGVPVLGSYRTYRSVGYRYRLRTEPDRSVREGLAAVPNTPVRFGRVFTEQIPPVYFGKCPTEHTLGSFGV